MKVQRLFLILLLLVVPACKSRPPRLSITPPAMPGTGGDTWWDDRVFYEVFVRSFQDSDGDGQGDLAGLIQRLDYLNDGDPTRGADLGVTGLWLMPVTESPSYHGYDVADYYAVEQDYGDIATLKALIEGAHQRGMVVIVDLVINHSSSQHPWFLDAAQSPQAERRDWYIWSEQDPGYQGPWGQEVWHRRGERYYYGLFWEGMPDLNYRNPAVTQQILDVTRFWLQEVGVDGFRMDAIRHLIEEDRVQENTPQTHQWLRQYHAFYKGVNPHALTVGEVWTNSENVVPYVGQEMDICFEFDLASAILSSMRGGTSGLVDSAAQKAVRLYPPGQYATFLTNHDHERAMTQLGEDQGRAKTAASIYLTLPGVPFVYYGEEIGMTGRKPDEDLRTPMQWTADEGAGFTTGIPWRSINRDYTKKSVAAQLADQGSLLNHYTRLIRIRAAYQALRTGDLIPVRCGDLHVYAYVRHGEAEDVLVVHNLGSEPLAEYELSVRSSPLPPAKYATYDLLNEARGAELQVSDEGAFGGYVPVPALQPLHSYVLLLR